MNIPGFKSGSAPAKRSSATTTKRSSSTPAKKETKSEKSIDSIVKEEVGKGLKKLLKK